MRTTTNRRERRTIAKECTRLHFETSGEEPEYLRRQLAADTAELFHLLLAEAARKARIEGIVTEPEKVREYAGIPRGDNASKLSYVARYTS